MNAVTEFKQTPRTSLVSRMAERFGVDPDKMLITLKATAFKTGKDQPEVSNEQMMALLVVAEQYRLNPWTKEIYAYPDKKNGIVPVVGVDGWSRIINERPELDGIEFNYSDETVDHKGKKCHEWIECAISRKDRAKPTVVREYFSEVVRRLDFATPWDTHPNRMHRHKTLIQCARVAFGFGGIYDQDEAERIVEVDAIVVDSKSRQLDPRGDLSEISDAMIAPHVKAIADLLAQDKDEFGIADDLRAYEAEHLLRFNELYIAVQDRLAKNDVISKANWRKYLKVGLDRGETHT